MVGGLLELHIFTGPSPEAVLQQYQEVIGRPALPPLWALGFHQCRCAPPLGPWVPPVQVGPLCCIPH